MKKNFPFLSILAALALVAGSCHNVNPRRTAASNASAAAQTVEQNKAIVLQLYAALNDTNWVVARGLVDSGFQHHYVKDTGFGVTSWSGFERGYRASQQAFPDWKLRPVTVVAEGEYVSVLLVGQGTQRGDFAGIAATNRKAGAPIMLLHQLRNGKIIADWEVMNVASFVEQLKK
ncbi:MAG: hypothetical protein EOO08_13860 [Chitinophagaceae bacterium]|nr:MAG: hypothetical protein EOO08_13860 [Chitinophagaceae bacterium]